MRDVLKIGLDCLLVGLAWGTGLMIALVVVDLGSLQAAVERGGRALLPVLMIAIISGVMIAGTRFGIVVVRAELREEREDALRRKFLIPAQRRRPRR